MSPKNRGCSKKPAENPQRKEITRVSTQPRLKPHVCPDPAPLQSHQHAQLPSVLSPLVTHFLHYPIHSPGDDYWIGVRFLRTIMLATGLCLATTAASAGSDDEVVSRANTNITLANGCVYSPHPSGQDHSWSLIYTKAAKSLRCSRTMRTKANSRQKSAAPAAQQPRASLKSGFVVGALR